MKERAEKNVKEILNKDGVNNNFLDEYNKAITSIPEILKKYKKLKSWSHCLVNSDSNSATLICQQPGEGNRLHYHPDWNEWWYIIEGEWIWEIEGVKHNIKKGNFIFIEKKKWHKITATGKKQAIRLAVSRYDVPHVYKDEE